MFGKIRWLTLLVLLVVPAAMQAQQLQAISQPDVVHVFENGVAFVQDSLALPGGAGVELVLPNNAIVDTLVLREDGARVPNYSVRRDANIVISWQSDQQDGLREITAEYLLQGMSWRPTYDMVIDDSTASAEFDFFAEIQNNNVALEDVELFLVAGSVGTSQPMVGGDNRSFNQAFADSDDAFNQGAGGLSSVTIQHVYEVGKMDIPANELLYTQIVSAELPVRRVLLWNANIDNEITVIYKVLNETSEPFSPGVVRSYRDGLILGSDPIERTPVGSEGSVTVGTLPDVRVARDETREQNTFSGNRQYDLRHTVTFEVENFGNETIELEIIDFFPADSVGFSFDIEPEREPGNVLRWIVTLEPGQSLETSYQFWTK